MGSPDLETYGSLSPFRLRSVVNVIPKINAITATMARPLIATWKKFKLEKIKISNYNIQYEWCM